MLNITAVVLFRAKARAFLDKARLNQIRTKRLDDVQPNPGGVGVGKMGLAASDKLICCVSRTGLRPVHAPEAAPRWRSPPAL